MFYKIVSVVEVVGEARGHLVVDFGEEFRVGFEDGIREELELEATAVIELKIRKHARIGLVRRVDIAIHVLDVLGADVEQVDEKHAGAAADSLFHFGLDEGVVVAEPGQCIGVVADVGDAYQMADILLDARVVAVLLLVVAQRSVDEG